MEYDSYFTYPLEKKNYDDLRMPSSIKSFLFVLILPKYEDEWIKHSVNELIIKKCMYWFDLKELPDSNNQTSVTLHLPKENYVSSEVLDNILFKIAEEELI